MIGSINGLEPTIKNIFRKKDFSSLTSFWPTQNSDLDLKVFFVLHTLPNVILDMHFFFLCSPKMCVCEGGGGNHIPTNFSSKNVPILGNRIHRIYTQKFPKKWAQLKFAAKLCGNKIYVKIEFKNVNEWSGI